MTKAELLKVVKQQKEEILQLKEVTKSVVPQDASDLNETAVSVVSRDGTATLVKISFNLDTKAAAITEITEYPQQTHMALYKANEVLNTEVFLRRR